MNKIWHDTAWKTIYIGRYKTEKHLNVLTVYCKILSGMAILGLGNPKR